MDDISFAADAATLDAIGRAYDPSNPAEQFDYWLKRLQIGCIAGRLRGEAVLELGCATGEFTTLLAPLVRTLDVVEGSAYNIEVASVRVPDARFVHSMWEEFRPEHRYSDVVMCNALEHVGAPVALLEHVATWLEPGGCLHVVVPNGLSLHRLVGVEMGMLPEPLHLSEGDIAQGHTRNYTLDTLLADVRAAGLSSVHVQPVFLKVLPNREMLDWDWSLVQALHRVAQRFPEHGAELYVVAERT